ncbi:MAG: hypothetical protein O3B31_01530 [Chloroflexi bacterium]|nr:hypothetical protein [Chloroflexota bacterium]MDA1002022.1 hypothetical protein [Chloroflexota bacterium]
MNVAPVRLAIAAVCFVLSLMALRVAIRRLIRALAVWLLGGALFMAAILFLVAGSWRALRARLARRRPRPAA